MEQINEIENYKICRLCRESLILTAFRPKRNMCKCCVNIRENELRKKAMRAFYYRNREQLLEYKRVYHKLNIGSTF